MTESAQDVASWTDHDIELPGRGRTSIREAQGPRDAPTLVLLHGLAATGRLNWFTALPALSERFRVIVVDHRGHGRGIRTHHFRLADCADDAVAVADHLGIESFIAVGYSMGGPIAKLCWSRHPDRVRGLVLCATANHFLRPEAQGAVSAVFPGMVVAARLDAPLFSGPNRRRHDARAAGGRPTRPDTERDGAVGCRDRPAGGSSRDPVLVP